MDMSVEIPLFCFPEMSLRSMLSSLIFLFSCSELDLSRAICLIFVPIWSLSSIPSMSPILSWALLSPELLVFASLLSSLLALFSLGSVGLLSHASESVSMTSSAPSVVSDDVTSSSSSSSLSSLSAKLLSSSSSL